METIFANQNVVILVQLVLAVVLGGLLGIQRSISHKSAGMRTFSLVSLGSCLLIIIGELVKAPYIGGAAFLPMQIPAAIITGIGFLGAGLIILKEDKLQGLTTAAGLWVSCGIGIAVGFRFFLLAIVTALLTLFIFSEFWKVEERIVKIEDGGKIQ